MLRQEYQKSSKYLRYLILLFITIVLGAGVILWHPFSTGYYSSYVVAFGKYNYPFITTELQNQNCALTVDIGSRFPLTLRRETLDRIIDKQPHGTTTVHNIDGQKREAPSYLIPKLKVGNMELKNVIAHESQKEDYDTLGQFFGGKFNLLMDFPNSRIIVCDTFSKLQAKKLAGKHWVRIPFEMHRGGIVFSVDTNFGTRRLVLNTNSTLSLLNSSVMPHGKPFVSSSFVLGGQQFGNVTFESIDLPEGLREIDGFIGMDFLKEHAIYFDYTHKVAYVEPRRKYFEFIPVTFNRYNGPTIDVSIQGDVYPLKLDLGSSIAVSLKEEILQSMHKTKYGTFKWFDLLGKHYESPTYTIPEIKIGNLSFANVFVNRDNEDFHANTTFEGLPLQLSGMIGFPILEKYNLLLDFPHAAIYASNDSISLQQGGLLSKNLLTVPFALHPDGIIFCVETDRGTYRLVLDTGSTYTVIRAPHPPSTEKFCIMGHDFGKRFMKVLDLGPQCDCDGVIGMDFLCAYPVFIDYPNKIVLIDLQPRNGSSK